MQYLKWEEKDLFCKSIAKIIINEIFIKFGRFSMLKKSCLTNLIAFFNKVTKLVNQGHAADIVFLDFVRHLIKDIRAYFRVKDIRARTMWDRHVVGFGTG